MIGWNEGKIGTEIEHCSFERRGMWSDLGKTACLVAAELYFLLAVLPTTTVSKVSRA
jgi:hypothetical protein